MVSLFAHDWKHQHSLSKPREQEILILNLKSILEMLPYFAAAAHHFHTKSAHIYLQIMQKLANKNKKEGLQTIYKIIWKT